MAWPIALSHRSTRCLILVFTALCFAVPLILLSSGTPGPFPSWLLDFFRSRDDALPEPEPASRFFQWEPMPSQFRPVNFDNVRDKSVEELCHAFPVKMLESIQPILKTGHGVIDARLSTHFQSSSACLDNLLIFSDLEEIFEGREIHDVIADIPSDLSHLGIRTHRDQFEAYDALQEYAANHTLDSANFAARDGWRTDKFKFLAGISRAWRMRPNRDWYVFFEDDTFVAWDNLFRMLGHFNPDALWYFGSPVPDRKPYEWPQTLFKDNHKMSFAYGGSGYVLSRAAMRRLVREDWNWKTGEYLGNKLSERWWEKEVLPNCCGDSILGWALWNEGVEVSGLWPMFSPTPARRITFNQMFWCKPLMMMHKPTAEEMVGIWRWEWAQRRADVSFRPTSSASRQQLTIDVQRPLLYRDLATTYFNFANLTTLTDWDNGSRGSYRAPTPNKSTLYSLDPHASFSACQLACEALPDCLQYSYHLRNCKFSNSFHFGERREPEKATGANKMKWTDEDRGFQAGWIAKRILAWIDERPCEQVEWVRPSTERIF